MLSKNIWTIFESTGNIEAYLYFKKYNEYIKMEEENKKQLVLPAAEVKQTIYL